MMVKEQLLIVELTVVVDLEGFDPQMREHGLFLRDLFDFYVFELEVKVFFQIPVLDRQTEIVYGEIELLILKGVVFLLVLGKTDLHTLITSSTCSCF